LLVEDGAVKETYVEPDNTGLNGEWIGMLFVNVSSQMLMGTVSAADKVL
jgi:hypothetical protein